MKREIIDLFEGKENVTHIINDNGAESWQTQEISFGDETFVKGACKLNTVENETKHVLFLFNSDDEEVGRYYLSKSLQGKTPSELVGMKQNLCFFESWSPGDKEHPAIWVPCVSLSSNKELTGNAIVDLSSNNNSQEKETGSTCEKGLHPFNEESNLQQECKVGLSVIYFKVKDTKKKLAVQYCEKTLKEIGEWEPYWENAKRCFRRSKTYGFRILEQDLSYKEKIVFFFKSIMDEINAHSEVFYKSFPEENHRYNDDNFRKLYDWLDYCRRSIPVKDLFANQYVTIKDLEGGKIAYPISNNLDGFFSALCQDGLIEKNDENLKTIKEWICMPRHVNYLDSQCTEDWIEYQYDKFDSRTTLLEKKLFYWTAIFKGEGRNRSTIDLAVLGRYTIFSRDNLKSIFMVMQRERMAPQKNIGEEGYYHEWY